MKTVIHNYVHPAHRGIPTMARDRRTSARDKARDCGMDMSCGCDTRRPRRARDTADDVMSDLDKALAKLKASGLDEKAREGERLKREITVASATRSSKLDAWLETASDFLLGIGLWNLFG